VRLPSQGVHHGFTGYDKWLQEQVSDLPAIACIEHGRVSDPPLPTIVLRFWHFRKFCDSLFHCRGRERKKTYACRRYARYLVV